MYTIIGGDGREYGPVSADQVRSWIAGGRANLDTKVKAAGSEEWKRIADVPEIIAPSSAATPPEVPPMATGLTQPASSPAASLDVMSCFERSWNLLKANFWPLVGISALGQLLLVAVNLLNVATFFLVSTALQGVIVGGLFNYFVKCSRGQAVSVGDAFAGFGKPFGALIAASMLTAIFIVVGTFCLILPGIYLAVAYSFTFILIIDKGQGFWDAMETSRKIITRQWWQVLLLLILGTVIMLVGALALVVGIFVAAPIVMGAVAYAYEDLVNPRR